MGVPMRSAKKKILLFLWLLVSLAFPVQLFADDNDDDGPAKLNPSVGAKSVLYGPTLATPLPQERPGQRFRAQQKVDKTPLNAAKVRKSIKRAVQYIRENQKADGSWKNMNYEGDTTALCTLALLNSEDLPIDPYKNSPHIKRALEYLADIPVSMTYVVSLRIMVMATADPKGKKYRLLLEKDVQWLVDKQIKNRDTEGSWNYGQRGGYGDSSNSQFALLALHEASKVGIKVPQETWQMALKYWQNCHRSRSGGFTYYVSHKEPKGSMTCAGISSVIIANENLADATRLVNGDFANCCQTDQMQDMIDSAFGWLARHYTVQANPLARTSDPNTRLYFLYGLERAGRLAGRRFVGPNDWYRDGAKQLLKTQHPHNDNWQTTRGHGENNPLVATSFALLFLSKGKRPVVIGKYDHGAPDWDLHPKGVHYLTRRLEKIWSVKLNWQTVKAESATVDDLLEAPVLFMSGRDLIELNQTQKDNLKKYLENGGFLFAEACQGDGCGNDAKYHKAFVALMAELFPDSRLEALARNHPIWNSQYPLVANPERPLLGLQACCRTSVIYCPKNLSCYWNLDRPAILDAPGVNNNLKQRVEYCTRLGVNVMAYATDRFNLREKGETPTLAEKNQQLLTDRVLVFPKLQHGGGDDDAPNAWRNVLRNVEQLGLEIKMDKKMIPAEIDDLADHPFIFLHGRNRFAFTNEQREAIRKHLDLGGFIFADSICASKEFTESFRKEMSLILANQPLVPIDPSHEIWTNQTYGYKIDRVTLRTKTKSGTFKEEITRPQLEGAEINGRLAVVFSPNDLSCALENTAKSQCTGYTHEDSLKISTNVVLYSLLSD